MITKANRENVVESIGFLGTITLFCLFSLLTCAFSKETISAQENRALVNFPTVHSWRKDIAKFPAAFEPYFKDRLPLRLPMISARNLLTYSIFNASGNPLVVVGKQNWLFYKSYGVTPAQLNLDPFSDEELQVWARDIAARKDFLNQHGIKYLLVLAPEKGSMYPEFLPDGWKRRSGVTRLEQLQNYLKLHTDVDFVDAHDLLLAEKTNGQKIYHTNDTHWNQRSAFLISQNILKQLHKAFPAVAPVDEKLLLQGHDQFTGDLAKMLGMQKTLPDFSPSIVVNQAPLAVPVASTSLASMGSQEPAFGTALSDRSLPRALVLRDSFCTYLTAPLSEHFQRAEYQWTNDFQPEAIVSGKPDVVINEIAERHLYEEFHEHVPVIIESKTGSKPICTFGQAVELVDMAKEEGYLGTKLILSWRAKKRVKLDYIVGVHCLDSNKKSVGGADYKPDIVHHELAVNTCWNDTLDIPNRELKNASNFGISIYRAGAGSLACDAPECDWNTRLVVSIDKLREASATNVRALADSDLSVPQQGL